MNVYAVQSDDTVTFTTTASAYLSIYGAQLEQFEYAGKYSRTNATTIIGSGHTGNSLRLSGFDPLTIVGRTGDRFEVINQFHTDASSVYERSEFKRLTLDLFSDPDGNALAYFDPPIRNTPVTRRDRLSMTMQNPVIFNQPELQARLIAGTIQYIEKPLQMTDVVFEITEDLTQ